MTNLISNFLMELSYILYKNINWPISWKVFEKYSNKINPYIFPYWNYISEQSDISLEFMEKYHKFLNYKNISTNRIFKNIDEYKNYKYRDRLNLTDILINNNHLINDDVLIEFKSRIYWDDLIHKTNRNPYIINMAKG